MAQQIKITQTSNADMNIGVYKTLTAVEWLFETMAKTPMTNWYEIREQAKAMEKKQIMDAANTLLYRGTGPGDMWAEQYYNDTYTQCSG